MNEPRVERSEAHLRLVSAIPGTSVDPRRVVSSELSQALADPRPAVGLIGTRLLRPTTPLALPEHRSVVTWRTSRAPLFGATPRPTDVRAGALDDCYFIAALSAIAVARPEWLVDTVTQGPGDDEVSARFFDLDGRGEVRVAVSARLPVDERSRRHLYAEPQGATWGAYAEKAYAAHYGGYERVGKRGAAAYALRELTGHATRTYRLANDGVAATHDAMALALRERRPMVAETSQRELDACGVALQGIVPGHSYAVLDVYSIADESWVTLYEPAGREEFRSRAYDTDAPPSAGARARRGDGVFRMRFDDFARRFGSVVVVTNERLPRSAASPPALPPPTHLERIGRQAPPGPVVCNLPGFGAAKSAARSGALHSP